MTFRHAAALALVGWYLLMPPFDKAGAYGGAPLSKWSQEGSYDTAAECMTAKSDYQKFLQELPKSTPDDKLRRNDLNAAIVAICVATDDPRLKEK